MEAIRIPKVEDVTLEKLGVKTTGLLHLTPHHMIFVAEGQPDAWTPYPLINLVTRLPQTFNGLSPISIRTRTFESFILSFNDDSQCRDVFDSVKDLTVAPSIEKLYAFSYVPSPPLDSDKGWSIYTPREEFTRMGVGSRTKAWRFTDINKDYQFSPTYPSKLVVPAKISDSSLNHAAKYRSKERIPALTYLHWANFASITRSSQPLVGLKNSRSIQDEKLIESIFHTHLSIDSALGPASPLAGPRSPPPTTQPAVGPVYGATSTNLIVDARPTTNALANTAKGAGTENMEHYPRAKKAYLGIENIHVMRESLNRVVEALRESEPTSDGVLTVPLDRQALRRSGWLKHTTSILEGSIIIVRNIHINSSHVLIHCSDGWDRTAQLSALSQLCLDPFYRTFKGFMILVEKDWLSFGHKFLDRCGHLSSDKLFHGSSSDAKDGEQASSAGGAALGFFASVQKQFGGNAHLKETSPVFHQFLDCVRQIQRQYPTRFEFNERFLRTLHQHLYSCQFGTFIFNSEKDRRIAEFGPRHAKSPCERTVSIWDWVDSSEERAMFLNPEFDPSLDDRMSRAAGADMGVLFPNPRDVRFWAELFGRGDEEMNGKVSVDEELPAPETTQDEDPIVAAVIEESQALDSGKLPPVLGRKDMGDAAAIPYQPRSRPGSSNDIRPATSQQSPLVAPTLPQQDTFRPFSSRTSAFSLQASTPENGRVSASSTQSSFPVRGFTSSPSTLSSPSHHTSHAGALSEASTSSSASTWGWAQFSSGAMSALSGAAKEISRAASTASSVAASSSSRFQQNASGGGSGVGAGDQPLGETWGAPSPSPNGHAAASWATFGPSFSAQEKTALETNPWAQDDEPGVLVEAGGGSLPNRPPGSTGRSAAQEWARGGPSPRSVPPRLPGAAPTGSSIGLSTGDACLTASPSTIKPPTTSLRASLSDLTFADPSISFPTAIPPSSSLSRPSPSPPSSHLAANSRPASSSPSSRASSTVRVPAAAAVDKTKEDPSASFDPLGVGSV